MASRPRGRQRKDADVSLTSTVGAPTPARRPLPSSSRAREYADVSLASTAATPAVPKKRGRPSKASLTTPEMRAFTGADTSASTATVPRPRGRPPKSIPATSTSRALASPNTSVSFSELSHRQSDTSAAPKKRGRPPKHPRPDADSTAASSSTPRPRVRPPKTAASPNSTTASAAPSKRRGRPPGSTNKAKAATTSIGLPQSKSFSRHAQPVEQGDSDVSLLDGEESPSESASEPSLSDDEQAQDSDDERPARHLKSKKRKGWPSERERLRKWRRLSIEERECVTSEGGLIWRTAIPLLNSMPKNIRSMVADSLTRALNRIDAKLESGLVPPLARIPIGSSSGAARRDLASSMLSWRLEEEGSLLGAKGSDTTKVDLMSLGMNAEIDELEAMLLPEAEQIVDLSKTLEHQSSQLERKQAEIGRLKRERKAIKSGGTSDWPANLEANSLISVTSLKQGLDPSLGSFFRLVQNK